MEEIGAANNKYNQILARKPEVRQSLSSTLSGLWCGLIQRASVFMFLLLKIVLATTNNDVTCTFLEAQGRLCCILVIFSMFAF